MKQRKWHIVLDYYSILIFIILNAGAISFTEHNSELFVFVNVVILSVVFLCRKRKLDNVLLYVFLYWGVINAMAGMVNVSDVVFKTWVGTIGRVLLAYLILKTVGRTFFDKWYDVCFVFSCIALALYPFLLFFHDAFYSLSPYLNFITRSQQTSMGGWYVVFYMFNGWADIRNSGFMWEPGAFACMLIFMLFFRLWRNGMRIDWHVVVLLLNLITTYSTAGYLALFFLVLYYVNMHAHMHKRYAILLPVLLIALLYGAYYAYATFDFLGGKIERYMDYGESLSYSVQLDRLRTNRLGFFTMVLKKMAEWPFGYGIVVPDYDIRHWGTSINAPNSLATLLQEWGVPGMLFLIYAFWKFSGLQYRQTKYNVLFIIALLIVMFSNPLTIRTFVYVLFFYPFIYRRRSKRLVRKTRPDVFAEKYVTRRCYS